VKAGKKRSKQDQHEGPKAQRKNKKGKTVCDVTAVFPFYF